MIIYGKLIHSPDILITITGQIPGISGIFNDLSMLSSPVHFDNMVFSLMTLVYDMAL